MSKKKRFLFPLRRVPAGLAIILILSGFAPLAVAQNAVMTIPSLGSGPYEVILFTDYFCPPCRRIDNKAESLLKEIVATGKVKLTFIDVPFNRVTPIYAKYYLYAAQADSSVNHILHVRYLLFEAAQERRIRDEKTLIAFLEEQKIAWKTINEKSVFPLLSAVIKEHKVDQTPTCVIRYSAKETKKFIGDVEIWEGLTKLKKDLDCAKE